MADKQKPIERVYKGTQQFHHDLFKLSVSKMLKFVGYQTSSKAWFKADNGQTNPDWLELEHTHIYHSVDSSGKIQIYSAPVGGHFHEIEVIRDKKDPDLIIQAKCKSGPLKWEVKMRNGKAQKIAVPVSEFDKHKHTVDYVRSDMIERTKLSAEAAKVIGQDATRSQRDVFDETGKRLESLHLG